MCFRFLYLLVTRGLAWLRLSRREEACKCAEILLLRHQLTLLRRQVDVRPKMTWADRALLAVLLGVIPRVRRAGLRLVVTPDTVLRWHRGGSSVGAGRRNPGASDPDVELPIQSCAPWFCAWPETTQAGATGASTAS